MGKLSNEQQYHSQEQNLDCPYCQRRFSTQEDLTLHVVTRHTQMNVKETVAEAANSGK
jgi:hypothetical protein